ncbi:hypothetical protein BSKO_07348 [Bryopsis sp. KO-2023]|nr:hypothetical protein BSKO_07348 [Bryopsis sp. KO-2023]
MLGRTRTAQRFLSHASSLGRREFSKKHHPKHKAKNVATESQSATNAPSPGAKPAATPSPPTSSSPGATASENAGAASSTSEKLFMGSGALICTGLGYYVWSQRGKSNQNGGQEGPGKTEDLSQGKWNGDGAKDGTPEATVLSTQSEFEGEKGVESGAPGSPENVADKGRSEQSIDPGSDGQNSTTQEASKSEPENDSDGTGENVEGSGAGDEPVTVDLEPINSLFQGAFGLESLKEEGGAQQASEAPAAVKSSEAQEDPDGGGLAVTESGSEEEKSTVDALEAIPTATLSLEEPPEGVEDGQTLAGALVKAAVEDNFGAGENWEDFGAMHKQAESDARVFLRWQTQEKKKHADDLKSREAQIKQTKLHLGSVEKARVADHKAFEVRYQRLSDDADHERKKALEQQESEMRLAASETSVKERVSRLKELDEVRQKLSGLTLAFKQRSKQAQTSHSAHKMALGVLALEECLEHGKPCQGELRSVQSGCQGDPLVKAALEPLSGFADRGVPTLLQLKSNFSDVRRDALALGMLPKEGGGLIAQAVAKLGAMLKIDEKATTSESISENPPTLDVGLSHVEASLTDGDVLAAANFLEKATAGTAAECVTRHWIADAKNRAAAELALKALHARATCLTLSIS